MWHTFIDELDEQCRINWDGSFAPAKIKAPTWVERTWNNYKVDGGGRWPRNTSGMFRPLVLESKREVP